MTTLDFNVNSNSFNPGYAIEQEDRKLITEMSTKAVMLMMGDLPERMDIRQTELFKNQNWLKVEDQGQIGSCFKGDTLVTMANGSLKKISDVKFGEYILSHNRIPRMVIDTMSREFSGKMYTIHVKGWNPVTMTNDHIVPVKRAGKLEWVKAQEVLEDDLMLVSSGVQGSSGIKKIDLSNYIEDLHVQEEDNKIRAVGCSKWINRYLEINDLATYCIGLYVAEGSTDFSDCGSPTRCNWTLHEKETNAIQKIKEWAELLGLECIITNKKNSKAVNVRIQNTILASFLKLVCGRFSNKKQIPWFILNGDNKQKSNFIYGYFDGDGSYRNSESTLEKNSRTSVCSQVYCTTANKSLQLQIASLCISLGMKPGLSITKKRSHQNFDSNTCYLYSEDANKIYNRSLNNEDFTQIGQWRKIRSIVSEDVKYETVYDITVDVDHSFIADGLAVHNCQGNSLTECSEFCYGVQSGRSIQLSRMYAYIRSQMFDNIKNDNGSTLSGGTKCALEGICLESNAPYPSRYPGWGYITSSMKEDAKNYILKSHTEIKQEPEVKRYIGSGLGIVHIGISWGNSMEPNSQGIISSFRAGQGGHAITLCGYVPDSDVGVRSSSGYFYLLKNSWSQRWGKGGFAYVDPRAVSQMLQHQWTVFIGRSDMTAPEPRPVHVDFTKKGSSING